MGKIFGFIGSPLKENSNTYAVTKMMLNKLIEIDENIEHELLTAGHVQINPCRGCWSCMKIGKCPQDKLDDMASLKQKMADADFIIWGSPVYVAHVSGQMKTFIDRIASWCNLTNLAGKAGMTVVATGGGSLEETQNYLRTMLHISGVKVVANLATNGTFPKTLIDPEKAKKEAWKIAEEVYPYVTGEKQVETDEHLERYFQVSKHMVTASAKWLPAHYKYWRENGILELNSFAEFLENQRFSKASGHRVSKASKIRDF